MHLNVLNETQLTQLELLKNFKREFTLVGGTAIALQIGHRKSIDFDLFKENFVNLWSSIISILQFLLSSNSNIRPLATLVQ